MYTASVHDYGQGHRRIPTAEPLTCYVILHVNQPWIPDDKTRIGHPQSPVLLIP